MKLKDLAKNYEQLGRTDPLWAIVSLEDKKGGKWDLDEFFALGEKEIAADMKYVGSLGIKVSRSKALDFGCGVGRLTQPLARYFDEIYGVDIAPSMIELAKKYNRHGDKVKYYLNQTGDLRLFNDNSLDFIYTNITLQHIKPSYSKRYIREFLRILAPDGILMFYLPSNLKINDKTGIAKLKLLIRRFAPESFLNIYHNIFNIYHKLRWGNQPLIEMWGIKRKDIARLLEENGAKIVDIVEIADADWLIFRYCVNK